MNRKFFYLKIRSLLISWKYFTVMLSPRKLLFVAFWTVVTFSEYFVEGEQKWRSNKETEKQIFEWVLNGTTNLFMRPNIRYNRTVYVDLGLHQILAVDELQGYVEVKLYVAFTYYLEGIDWLEVFPDAPTKQLWLPAGTFWAPDMVFTNVIKVRSCWSD